MTLEALIERIDPNKYIIGLSDRKDLTWDIIQKYHTLQWSIECLSRLALLDYIEQNQNILWNFSVISQRKDLNIDFIRLLKDKLKWDCVSFYVNFQNVIENPDLPWNYSELSNRPICLDFICQNINKLSNYYDLLSNHIDLRFVYANKDMPWYYPELSSRVDLDFIRQNPHCKWDYYYLSQNPNLTIEFILEHLDKPWEWNDIYHNPNITLENLIKYNLHSKNYKSFQRIYSYYCIENLHDFDWKIISKYASLDIIKKYPNKPWDYYHLSINPNITIDFVLEHQNEKWNYSTLSSNPGITLQDVLDNWDKPWDISRVIAFKY